MKRPFLFVALLLGLGMASQAQQVSEQQAHKAAIGFYNSQNGTSFGTADLKPLLLPDMPHLRAYSIGEAAFVVVSTDLRVDPILGYSFENAFPSPLHPELRYWLQWYEEQIAALPAATKGGSPHYRWALLTGVPTEGEDPTDPQDDEETDEPAIDPHRTAIHYMLQTVWDQSPYYNNLCPFDNNYGELTVVGCTATAMAQLMKYWEHPSCGVGSHTYEHDVYGELSADFGNTTYIWSKMPSNLSQATPADYIEATAVLSYHCGVATEMDYGTSQTGGSGAHVINYGNPNLACSENAFRNYFKYSPDLHGEQRYNYGDSTWIAMINEDLEHGRPILYTGYDSSAGHAFVLDGRDTMGCYHFNWGWSGLGNGMFKVDSLHVGVGGTGANSSLTFNMGQQAIFGVEPVPEVFDTVEYYDTFCPGMGRVQFFEYSLPAREADYQLVHLTTVYNLHLSKTVRRQATVNGNGGTGEVYVIYFCPPTGLVMPENTFERQGYHFVGWSFSYNGNGTVYQPGDIVKRYYNGVLYAVWEADEVLGIEASDLAALQLYPNPTISVTTIANAEGATYHLLDAMGRLLQEGNIRSNNHKIDLSAFESGLYFLQLSTSKASSICRIIKQ